MYQGWDINKLEYFKKWREKMFDNLSLIVLLSCRDFGFKEWEIQIKLIKQQNKRFQKM